MNRRFFTRWPLLAAGCILFVFAVMAAEKATPEKWQALFNGRDLEGWAPMHQVSFTVTNGNLHLASGTGWLRTQHEYSDFIFEVEWRALEPGYDSGFFIRSGLEGDPWPKDAWQVDLNGGALGGLVKGNKTVVPAETPRIPLRQWVKFRIEVRGHKVTLDVDGERVWEYEKLDVERGYIGIEAENKSFEFRNLRMQELESSK